MDRLQYIIVQINQMGPTKNDSHIFKFEYSITIIILHVYSINKNFSYLKYLSTSMLNVFGQILIKARKEIRRKIRGFFVTDYFFQFIYIFYFFLNPRLNELARFKYSKVTSLNILGLFRILKSPGLNIQVALHFFYLNTFQINLILRISLGKYLKSLQVELDSSTMLQSRKEDDMYLGNLINYS